MLSAEITSDLGHQCLGILHRVVCNLNYFLIALVVIPWLLSKGCLPLGSLPLGSLPLAQGFLQHSRLLGKNRIPQAVWLEWYQYWKLSG